MHPKHIKITPIYVGAHNDIQIPANKPTKLNGFGKRIPVAILKQIKIMPQTTATVFGTNKKHTPVANTIKLNIPINNVIFFLVFISIYPINFSLSLRISSPYFFLREVRMLL